VLAKADAVLKKYEPLIIALLLLSSVLINLQGITWGLPNLWNPDEIVHEANLALQDNSYHFDETDFNYPSLPKYVMYGLGKVVYGLGYPTGTFYLSARILSVLLSAAVIYLTYRMVRKIGGSIIGGIIAALLVTTNVDIISNSHFAHNDIYLALFVCLAVYCLISFQKTSNRLWLYGAFFSVGLAASSKYNGGAMILAGYIVYFIVAGKSLLKDLLRTLETLALSTLLSFLGYVAGTPKALLWMVFYIKRLIPSLTATATVGQTSLKSIGLLGQWKVLYASLGLPVSLLFLFSLLGLLVALIFPNWRRKLDSSQHLQTLLVILVSMAAFDLPIALFYNYPSRFFISFVPMVAVLSIIFLENIIAFLENGGKILAAKGLLATIILVIVITTPRVASILLLFKNDARIPAGDFVASLPAGTSIEFGMYPPNIPKDHFLNAHSYPIIMIKFPNQEIPTSIYYTFNEGEVGIEKRKPDYLITDSLTYDRFLDPAICAMNQAECNFYHKLVAGQTNYRLIASFSYKLPSFLPQLKIFFLNPKIQIYERVK
jgi:hypothetical protein